MTWSGERCTRGEGGILLVVVSSLCSLDDAESTLFLWALNRCLLVLLHSGQSEQCDVEQNFWTVG